MEAIKINPLFKDAKLSTVEMVIGLCGGEKRFEQGADITAGREKGIGIMLSGHAKIVKSSADKRLVIMRRIGEGQMFGAAQVFLQGEGLSSVIAEEECGVFFVDKPVIEKAIKMDPAVALNYISFLSGRIHFLNRKIEGFTGFNAKSRLKMYLSDNSELIGGEYVLELEGSLKELAETLNVGRASLYRAMDGLEEEGAIERNRRRIVIKDISALYAD